jgi:DNA-binding IclR family transcriptional regulator
MSGTQSADRVADVLLFVAAGERSVGVSAVARGVGLSKAVVHRILRSLAARQLVAVDAATGAYALGPAAAALGARALRDFDLRTVALPVIRGLHEQTGETATVSALVGSARVYVDQLVSVKQIRMTVELGRPYPLHAGASSKAILAIAPADLRERVLAGALPALTPRTITDREALVRELSRIADEGVAVSAGERQAGAGSVAAGVLGLDGSVAGSISVCGPVDRFDAATVEALKPLVRAAAAEISGAMRH